MEVPPPTYQEALIDGATTGPNYSNNFQHNYIGPSLPSNRGDGGEICVCPQHGVVPRLNICICGRDNLLQNNEHPPTCQNCNNVLSVQNRNYSTVHSNDANFCHATRDGENEQSLVSDVTVQFDTAKGTVNSLASTRSDPRSNSSAECLPMIADNEGAEEEADSTSNCNIGSVCAASFLAIIVIVLITIFTFFLT